MTTTITILTLIESTAADMDAVPAVEPVKGALFAAHDARFQRAQAQQQARKLGVKRIITTAEQLSVWQQEKLRSMICRAGHCDVRWDDAWGPEPEVIVQHAHPLDVVLERCLTADSLRQLAKWMR